MVRIGIGRQDITPPIGIPHTLWGARSHDVADRIHQPLLVTVLAIWGDGHPIILVDLDLPYLTSTATAQLRQQIATALSVPAVNVSLGWTHTHGTALWDADSRNGDASSRPGMHLMEPYREKVRFAVMTACMQACERPFPARCAAGYGSSEITFNRRLQLPSGRVIVARNPDGPRDTTISLLRFDGLDGGPIATIVGYGTHPIILGHQNSAISPDYPGTTRQVFEDVVGGVCLFRQGCAGDQIPYEAISGDLGLVERIGKRLGADAASAALAIDTHASSEELEEVIESGAPLGMWRKNYPSDSADCVRALTRNIALPMRELPPLSELQAEADAAQARFEPLDAKTCSPDEFASAHMRLKRAFKRLALGKQALAPPPIELHAVRIGDMAMLTAPLELFSSTGLAIRAASPFPVTFVGGYANGNEGYLPLREDYDVGGYEIEFSSCFAPDAEEVLRREADDLLRVLWQQY